MVVNIHGERRASCTRDQPAGADFSIKYQEAKLKAAATVLKLL
jgi:hypothetical protein